MAKQTSSGHMDVYSNLSCLLSQDQGSDTTEVHASFRSISVLLIRGIKQDGAKCVRKVADLTVSDLIVNASLGDEQDIDGTLGGLRMLDLTPEGSLYKTVFTCGCPLEKELSLSWILPLDGEDGPSVQRAFTFSLLNPKKGGSHKIVVEAPSGMDVERNEIAKNIQVSVHMASAQYIYTHRFLSELVLCGGDYTGYATELGESLRQAASSVAMNLVSKRRALAEGLGYLSSSFVHPLETAVHGGHSIASDEVNDIIFEGQDFEDNLPRKASKRVYASVVVETPVVHLPKTSTSSERFVAQLGRIDIRNTHLMEIVEEQDESGNCVAVEHDVDRLLMEIKDMSLYFLSLSEDESRKASSRCTPADSFLSDKTFTDSRTHVHILHKTAFHLTLDRRSEVTQALRWSKSKKPTIRLSGKVATPLQLELSTQSYTELFETINNLGGGKEATVVPPPFGNVPWTAPGSPTMSTWYVLNICCLSFCAL